MVRPPSHKKPSVLSCSNLWEEGWGWAKLRCCIVFAAYVAGAECAKRSQDVAAAYVPPLQYDQYSCSQLAGEVSRVSQRAGELSGVQDSKRTSDKIATAAAKCFGLPHF